MVVSQLQITNLSQHSGTRMQMETSNIQLNVDNQSSRKTVIPYPCLDIFSSPRVFAQKIDHQSIKLCAYTNPIKANNATKTFQSRFPDPAYLRPFEPADGLIHSFKAMAEAPWAQRPYMPDGPLEIKVLICVCMYNQSKNAINLTLKGIYDNLQNLEQEGISAQEVAVVLIQDGILKLVADRDRRTLAKGSNSMVEFYRALDQHQGKPVCALQQRINIILDEIDNYQRQGLGSYVGNNKDFPPSIEKHTSLLYQNLWDPSLTDFNHIYDGMDFRRKLKLFTCFKHLNGTKLSSHLWFFEGFCRYLEPKFIVLLDVGTKPCDVGVVNLLRTLEQNNNCGGATGLMSVDANFPSEEGGDDQESSSCLVDTFFSIEKAQEYQYVMAHFLDKNAEGALGFLHVLPGAWSAYRYKALIKSQRYEPTLLEQSYFKTILNPDFEWKDYREANMYLAEDRILSLGIYCQIKSAYTLHYVPDAVAYTDPMKTHQDLMKQRRRWINSSLFAFLYVWKNYYFNVMESKHGAFDKYVKLNLSMILSLLSFGTSYLTPSLYFYVLFTTIHQINPQDSVTTAIAKIVSVVYLLVVLIAIGGGLIGSAWTSHAHIVSILLAFFTFSMWGLVSYNIFVVYLGLGSTGIDTSSFNQMSVLIMTIINVGLYYFVILMHLPTHCNFVWRTFKDYISYLTYQGAYAQTMVIHAFCNVDDVSWGTKGSTAAHGENSHQTSKVFYVSSWLFWNCILAYIMVYVDIIIPSHAEGPDNNRRLMLIIIGIYGTVQMATKAILAIYHHFKWCCMDMKCCRSQVYPNRIDAVTKFWEDTNLEYQRLLAQRA